MSKKITVDVECKQMMHFHQRIEMLVDDYEKLKGLDLDDVTQRSEPDQYNILEGYINFNDIMGSEYEFKDVRVQPVSTK